MVACGEIEGGVCTAALHAEEEKKGEKWGGGTVSTWRRGGDGRHALSKGGGSGTDKGANADAAKAAADWAPAA
jgi:hypothetical protein